MITFHVLGTPDLRGPDGRHITSPVAGAKRLALLAYLALAGRRGMVRRDRLLGLFWPDSDQRSARNALSNMLHQVRRSLGPEVVVTRGRDEVGLAEGLVEVDAHGFEALLAAGRLAEALELYGGELLEGVFVTGASAEFEHWLDGERARLRSRAVDAARALYEGADAEDRPGEALRWARWAWGLDRCDERAACRLIALLDAAGDRAAALRTYDELAARLEQELGAEPSEETRALAAQLRKRARGAGPERPRREPAAGAVAWKRDGLLPVRTVAVLPFENVAGSAEAEPIALGLHDDLLTELSRISALRVIARTSVARYRGTDRPIPEIARELGVGTVVEGRVRTSGGRLRLNVQVVDAATGAHRRAERYDRELSAASIFDLQGHLAREIAGALEAELTVGERRGSGRQSTGDLEAYRLCVQGRALLDQRTPRAMHRSVEYFERAIERDPEYALAWAGLADALSLLEFYDHPAPLSAPEPMEAALRAVELGPELGPARSSLGILRSIRHQGEAARRELERAIALTPSHPEAHAWLGWVRLLRGEPAEALEAAERAVELDPLAPAFRAYLAEAHLAVGSVADALREAVRAREIQPEYGLAHFMEGLVLAHAGRLDQACEALETAHGLVPPWGAPRHSEVHAVLALIAARAGDRAEARARLARIDGSADPFSRGLVLAALGEIEDAFTAMARVRTWGSFAADHARYFFPHELGPLRGDPRFRDLLARIDASWRGGGPA